MQALEIKLCVKCKVEKTTDSFPSCRKNSLSTIYYIHSYCKSCHSSRVSAFNSKNKLNRLKSAYGLTVDQYEQMLHDQNYSCKICNKHKSKQNKNLSVDHCHKTGKIRGLLCDCCNRGIGLLRDDAKILQSAVSYLLENK